MAGVGYASVDEAVEDIDGLGGADLEALRTECQTNLYFLCRGVLGFRDVNKSTHGGFCRHIQSSPKLRRLGLMPRGHLKSTIATVGDSIRIALAEPNHARILIASETATLAEKFLGQIKGHFESNRILRGLFPELIPERFTGPGVVWRSDMATVRRDVVLDSPTWQAVGVGGQIVGSHFTRIKCDDLIGFDALKSAATMSKAKAWVDYMQPLLIDHNVDIIDFIGTRWTVSDLYAHIMEMFGEEIGVFTRSAIEDGEIIFPQKYNWTRYENIQRTNPHLWAAQYNNNPLSDAYSDLPVGSLRSFGFSNDGQDVILQGGKRWSIEQLDRVLTADPNSGSLVAPDCAAYSVQGVTPEDDVVVLESWGDRVTSPDFVDKLFGAARRWDVRVVGIEKAGQQNTGQYFEQKCRQENFHPRVEALTPSSRGSGSWEKAEGKDAGKADRIRSFMQPVIKSGRLHLLPSQESLRQQITQFPGCLLWDELDALAYGPLLWQKPATKEEEERSEGVVERLLARMNSTTGY